MLDDEDVVDPESAVQFGAVLKEMQTIFHRTEGDPEDWAEKPESLPGVKSWGKDTSNLDVLLTAPPSWRPEKKSCRIENSLRVASSSPQKEGTSVFKAIDFCEDDVIKYEGGSDSVRHLDGKSHNLYDEDGETGYHSMTTNSSSDSSSLDGLSPSPTTAVDNVRALSSSSSTTTVNCPLLRLPDKLFTDHLLSLLGPRDLVRFSASCRRLQRLCWSSSSSSLTSCQPLKLSFAQHLRST